MTFPTLSVQVKFGHGPFDDDTGSETFTTVRPKQIQIGYGKTTELDPTPPAAASMLLDNSDRAFDPLNSAGAHYGQLLPGREVRIKATWLAVDYPVWIGWTQEWPQTYSPPATAEVTVPMTDALGLVARQTLPESVYAATIAAEPDLTAWYRMDEVSTGSTGSTAATEMRDSSGNRYHGVYHGGPPSQPGLIAGSTSTAMGFNPTAVPSQWAEAHYAALRNGVTYSVIELWWTGDPNPGSTVADLRLAVLGVGRTNDAAGLMLNSNPGLSWRNYADADAYMGSAFGYNRAQRNHAILSTPTGGGGSTDTHLWVNGFLVDSYLTPLASPAFSIPVTLGLRISDAIYASVNNDALITVDEVSIYSTVAHPTFAADHWAAGSAPWQGDSTVARLNRILGFTNLTSLYDTVSMTGTGRLWYLGPASLDITPLEYVQRLETTENGRLVTNYDLTTGASLRLLERNPLVKDATIVAAFTDDPAGTLHYESITIDTGVDRVRNVVTVKYPDGTYLDAASGNVKGPVAGTVQRTDSASVVTYGTRTLDVDTVFGSINDAEDLAEYLVARNKDTHVRVTELTINPAADNRLWPAALGIKLGDRVSVRRYPQSAGSAFTVHCQVDGITHNINDGVNEWTTTYLLSTLDLNADGSLAGWWKWGTSMWDDPDMRWYF